MLRRNRGSVKKILHHMRQQARGNMHVRVYAASSKHRTGSPRRGARPKHGGSDADCSPITLQCLRIRSTWTNSRSMKGRPLSGGCREKTLNNHINVDALIQKGACK